ncbi:MAG: sugar nucleotide-binding protein [Gemmataceae bacterium]
MNPLASHASGLLVFGARGYLGQSILGRYPSARGCSLDIADRAAVASELDAIAPSVVINCAGKTGRPNVDWCEDHKPQTLRANVTGPLVLLEECLRRGIYLVHFSSGCIYQGDNAGQGWSESDPPNYYGSFYSRTKAWSDQMLAEFPVLVLRLRMPFDGTTAERNLIMKIRKYNRLLTEPNSITYLPDLLQVLDTLMTRRATGVYNVVNPGAISPYEIMQMYREVIDPSVCFEPLELHHLGQLTRAGRSNCLLNTAKLQREGLILAPVREALQQALLQLREQLFQPVPAV